MSGSATGQVVETKSWPGDTTEIIPAKAHGHFDVATTHVTPACLAVTDPGAQGPLGTGVHGCGVSTPDAAEVAEATAGLARLMHNPNGAMLAGDATSVTVATAAVAATPRGATVRVEGSVPMEHCRTAPVVTMAGTASPSGGHRCGDRRVLSR